MHLHVNLLKGGKIAASWSEALLGFKRFYRWEFYQLADPHLSLLIPSERGALFSTPKDDGEAREEGGKDRQGNKNSSVQQFSVIGHGADCGEVHYKLIAASNKVLEFVMT